MAFTSPTSRLTRPLHILGAKVWMEMHFALELDNLGAKNWAESHILEGQDFNCARDTDNWESEL